MACFGYLPSVHCSPVQRVGGPGVAIIVFSAVNASNHDRLRCTREQLRGTPSNGEQQQQLNDPIRYRRQDASRKINGLKGRPWCRALDQADFRLIQPAQPATAALAQP